MHNDPVMEKPRHPIDLNLQELASLADLLEQDVEELLERISPILAPQQPQPEPATVASATRLEPASQISDRVNDVYRTVRRIKDRVLDATQRLEV